MYDFDKKSDSDLEYIRMTGNSWERDAAERELNDRACQRSNIHFSTYTPPSVSVGTPYTGVTEIRQEIPPIFEPLLVTLAILVLGYFFPTFGYLAAMFFGIAALYFLSAHIKSLFLRSCKIAKEHPVFIVVLYTVLGILSLFSFNYAYYVVINGKNHYAGACTLIAAAFFLLLLWGCIQHLALEVFINSKKIVLLRFFVKNFRTLYYMLLPLFFLIAGILVGLNTNKGFLYSFNDYVTPAVEYTLDSLHLEKLKAIHK